MLTSILLLPLARAAEPALEGPSVPAAVGAPLTFTLRESLPGVIVVDGCVPVELERREGGAWAPHPVVACAELRPATEVRGEVVLSLNAPAVGEWRALVAWGSACTAGVAFPMAGCGRWGVATSAPFQVIP